MSAAATTEPLWRPSAERVAEAQITGFLNWLSSSKKLNFTHYESLWTWSTEHPEDFWAAIWEYFKVETRRPYHSVMSGSEMPFVKWFEGSELNYVDQVFRHHAVTGPAIIYESEAAGRGEICWPEFQRQVAALASTLRGLGVAAGDRVVGYLPNVPHAVIAFLATASIGAVWSVGAPDMGPVSIVDRFKQIGPKVLIASDGYRFAGRHHDRRETLRCIIRELPTVKTVVWVEHLLKNTVPTEYIEGRRYVGWAEATAGNPTFEAASLPASHPLWILYSSGTTGLPKAIVHSHAGMVVSALMQIHLHWDVKRGDRVLWNSSTSWMVWNAHVSCLLTGATLVLFDGAPTGADEKPDWTTLWQLIERERITFFGAGAAFHHACLKAGVIPSEFAHLDDLQTVASTGSPLSIDGYRWLISAVKKDIWINSVSGGTDICSAFVGGLPTLPVYAGEIQCRILGCAVESFNEQGQPILDAVGELVCTRSLPSMPLYFWDDRDNRRYLESYFETFKGPHGERIWRHGDWLRLVRRPKAVGAVIYGRSDATINRQGIRMGTAELYRAVEAFHEILDSMAVDLEYLGRESYMALFIVLRANATLTLDLESRLRQSIRAALSPRHVPNEIIAVPDIPRTLTGKKLELPIKKLLLGHPVEKVVSRDALANPASLDWYIAFAQVRLKAAPNATMSS